MADNLRKYTTQEVLNKVFTDSSGNAIGINPSTTKETLNAVFSTSDNSLNVALSGGSISGDVTISGDLTVNGSATNSYDEIVNGDLHVKSDSGNSTSAFLVEKNDGTDVFVIDTTNSTSTFTGTVTASAEIISKASLIVQTGGGTAIGSITSSSGDMVIDGDSARDIVLQSGGGNVGIGGAPDKLLTLGQDATDGAQTAYLKILDKDTDTTADTLLEILWSKYHTGTDAADVASIGGGIEQWSGTSSARNTYMDFRTVTSGSRTEKMRITSAGDILIKTADAKIKADSTNTLNIQAHHLKILGSGGEERFHFQSEGNSNPSEFSMKGDDPNITMIKLNTNGDSFIHGKSNSAVGLNITAFSSNEGKIPRLRLRHSNNNTVGTDDAVDDGDSLGEVAFQGYDGSSEYNTGASILAKAGATFSTSEARSELIFNVASGSQNPTEKLRLSHDGILFVGGFSGLAAPELAIKSNTTGNGLVNVVSFRDSNNAQQGYLGYGSSSHGNINLYNALGGLNFYAGSANIRFALDDNSRISLSNNDASGAVGTTLFGYQAALNLVSGAENGTYIGHMVAGNGTITNAADSNTAIGFKSMFDLTSGSANTAVGYRSAFDLTSGTGNTAIGFEAGTNLTTGSLNTFVGYLAGHGSDSTPHTASWNTCIGEEAGYLLQGGANANTLVGQGAGDSITTGLQNTCIGRVSDVSGSTAENQLVLGYGATGTGDNQVAIGNTSITSIKAQVSSITPYSSDERTKKDVKDYDLKGLDFVNELNLKTYIYKNPADFPDEIRDSKWNEDDVERPADPTETQVGLIAQEVEAALAKHGVGNVETYAPTQDSGIKTLTYGNLIFPLIKAVQELSARIEELESK
jgi:hypothetical protein